jgi:hypothetical protein
MSSLVVSIQGEDAFEGAEEPFHLQVEIGDSVGFVP